MITQFLEPLCRSDIATIGGAVRKRASIAVITQSWEEIIMPEKDNRPFICKRFGVDVYEPFTIKDRNGRSNRVDSDGERR